MSYRLAAVILGDGGHFISNLVLDGEIYRYDDLKRSGEIVAVNSIYSDQFPFLDTIFFVRY